MASIDPSEAGERMNALCKVFGHQPPIYADRGWFSPGEEYAVVKGGYTDGVGRVHAEVISECPRCKEKFKLCRIHIPIPTTTGEIDG